MKWNMPSRWTRMKRKQLLLSEDGQKGNPGEPEGFGGIFCLTSRMAPRSKRGMYIAHAVPAICLHTLHFERPGWREKGAGRRGISGSLESYFSFA